MIKTSTQNDLIQLAYNELNSETSQEVSKTMVSDDAVFDEFVAIQSMKELLSEVKYEPSEKTLEKIMLHAKTNSNVTSC